MNRFGLVGVGAAAGFTAALIFFPAAHGADSVYRQLDLFHDAFETVRKDYVHPVDDNELVNSAIQGMVSCPEPHSMHNGQKGLKDMQIQTRGQFGRLGLEVTMEDGLVKV